jgi:hypothetical protein
MENKADMLFTNCFLQISIFSIMEHESILYEAYWRRYELQQIVGLLWTVYSDNKNNE